MVAEAIRKIVEWRKKETLLNLFIKKYLRGKYVSRVEYYDTPLGEKVVIYCARPRLVVGKAGEGANELANILKEKFGFKNPQIEARPVENPFLDAEIVAERTVLLLERYGTRAYRAIGYRMVRQVMEAGARGVEIRISGKCPGDRGHSWLFKAGYMKKSGEVNKTQVRKALNVAVLPQGVIGVKVRILPPDVTLPDEIKIKDPHEVKVEELAEIDPEIAEKFKEVLEQR